jgi:hypothetical protein
MPCTVYFTPARSDDETRCDLDISHISTTIAEPYFDIYGFKTLNLNDVLHFEIPRVLLGSASSATLLFQVLEETEGFNDYFVEVYKKQLTIPLISQVTPTVIANTVIPDSEVNHSPIYTFTVPITVPSPDMVVLQLP